jgi:ribulose-5-phosphate 4-epimerase/fuculose-1-phosphate aldolase
MMQVAAAPLRPHSVRDRVTEAEWQVRVDLAACYRLIARYGMSDLIYNHITAKLPSNKELFLINPFGMHYTDVTASCFYTLDLQGNVVDKPEGEFGNFPVNKAGFELHSAVHGARHDLGCVIHTHTRGHGHLCFERRHLAADPLCDAVL